jgi:rhamnulokinase
MKLISVDLGAQSGRVAVGSFDGRRLAVSEVHRFPNVPVRIHERLHWDPLRLYDGLVEGMRAAARQGGSFASVAVDGWGVDFGLLDRAGRLLQNPVHYRDRRTERAFDEVRERVPPREIFQRTGNQLLPINTIYQLWAMVAGKDPVLDVAERLLLMPDLFHYWLSGVPRCELTEATTTQCYDPVAGDWAWDLVGRLGLPGHLLGEVVPPGTVLGSLRAEVAEETGLGGVSVITPASHDTASAVAAMPFRQPGSAYISSGTWSVVGMEVDRPVIDEHAFAANLTNEGGAGGMFQLLSNGTGLWLLHECRRTWDLHGQGWEFTELVALAESAPPLGALVDPNDPVFLAPGDMPQRIADWCRQTGQSVPDGPAAMVRCVLESLALAYRQTIELLTAACGISPPAVHIVGGGARNELLCQLTADATGLPVWAGPTEASEVGNLLVQAMALGELSSLEDARAVVAESFSPVLYEPRQRGPWDDAYQRFGRLGRPGRGGPGT